MNDDAETGDKKLLEWRAFCPLFWPLIKDMLPVEHIIFRCYHKILQFNGEIVKKKQKNFTAWLDTLMKIECWPWLGLSRT